MEAKPSVGRATSPWRALTRSTLAVALIVAAIASLAITSLIEVRRARGESVQPAPSMLTVPLTIPLDSGELGPFAFGHLEFDWDPASGVPGFSSWPSGRPSK